MTARASSPEPGRQRASGKKNRASTVMLEVPTGIELSRNQPGAQTNRKLTEPVSIPGVRAPEVLPLNRDGRLTRQEERVVQLAAAGLTNREVADQLNLSCRTIENHVARILDKLGLTSRRHLSRYSVVLHYGIE